MEKIDWADFKGLANPILEAYRELRANLLSFSSENECKLIAVTSPVIAGEKSSVVAGLGIVLAQTGRKVLIIDGNFDCPVHQVLFDLPHQGITDCIAEGTEFHTAIQQCVEQENLDILCCGAASFQSGDILGSNRMQNFLTTAREEYDYIFLDVQPAEAVADAVVVGAKTDGVLLVLISEKDKMDAFKNVRDKLLQIGANIIGCVLIQ